MVSVPDVREMLKEYALLDGAFVVSGEGLLEAAGRYITVDTSFVSLPKGNGNPSFISCGTYQYNWRRRVCSI